MKEQDFSKKEASEGDKESVPFSFEELFFSRTDERGIILAGNSVFQRISMYEWDELIKKPHNLIRHEDMPKAVFWLLWETIKKGEPIGAYVKNKAKDGRYYWVFAIVTPVEGGYLSVRLKPSSPVFKVVEQEYKGLLAIEQGKKLRPNESAVALLKRIGELGFADYGALMATALSHEVVARDAALGRAPDPAIAYFDELVKAAQSLLKQANVIFDAYAKNEYVPLNLRIQAAQLGEEGGTIGVISNNYNIISTEIKNSLDSFIASAQEVFHTINSGLFLLCTARIQGEVLELFRKEIESGDTTHHQAEESGYLEKQQKTYHQKAMAGLYAITKQAIRFHQACTDMKRLAAALEVTRVMGKVESARLTVKKDGLTELIDDLEVFQSSVAEGLKEIEQMNRSIQYNTQQLLDGTNG